MSIREKKYHSTYKWIFKRKLHLLIGQLGWMGSLLHHFHSQFFDENLIDQVIGLVNAQPFQDNAQLKIRGD